VAERKKKKEKQDQTGLNLYNQKQF